MAARKHPMQKMWTDKKFDPVTRATWERLQSAGHAPIAGKPHGAERMDQNPTFASRAFPMANQTAIPMKLVPTTSESESFDGLCVTMRIELDLGSRLGDVDQLGKMIAEVVKMASSMGDVLRVAIDTEGVDIELDPADISMKEIARKRNAIRARLQVMLAA